MRAGDAAVQLEAGSLSLTWAAASWAGLAASCRLSTGEEHRSESWSSGDREGAYDLACGPLDLRLTAISRDERLELRVVVRARASVHLAQLSLEGRPTIGGAAPEWLLYNGYQSWDPSGVIPAAGATGAGEPAHLYSWWSLGLADGDGAGLAAMGAGPVETGLRFELQGGSLRLVFAEADAVEGSPDLAELEPGREWTAPAVRFVAGRDVRSGLASLAGEPRLSPVPRGWLSWYHHGPWVTAEDVLRNSERLAEPAFGSLARGVIQVDDGWQEAYGDWVPNSKFPGGLRAVAETLARRGQTLGVWTAPFLVSAGSKLAAEAPDDWFVGDPAGGRAVDPRHMVFGPMHVLDARRPAVQDHLRSTFSRLREEGVRYFKIDFLYAGAYAGTPALRAGVAAIREAVGDGYVLACGAPLLPMLGLADGCRIGQDTATPIFDFEAGSQRPSIFGEEVASVVRNVAARQPLAGWFQLDADVALVGGNLTLEQARQLVTVAALSGGPFFASDELGALPAERLELLTNPEVLELIGCGCAVPDWQPDPGDRAPEIWRLEDVFAVFNWGPGEREIEVWLGGEGRLRDLWARADAGAFKEAAAVPVPAGGVRLMKVSRG